MVMREGTKPVALLHPLSFCSMLLSANSSTRPHVSQIANERVNNVGDYVKEGQTVRVKVLETDERGKIRLSMKALLNESAG